MIRRLFISLGLILIGASVADAQIPRVQTGGAGDQLAVSDGLSADIFARRLGRVADMARADDGTLFFADRNGGRIVRVIDRDQNGVSELTQPLPHLFDGPGGIAIMGETLFVSDRGGVWRIDASGGTPVLLAPFANADVDDVPAPLTALPNGKLRLGLNLRNGTTRLIEIDPVTGRADAIETSNGRILSFATRALPQAESQQTAPIWVILQRGDTSLAGSLLSTARPLSETIHHLWLDPATGRALTASDGLVSEARASFGGLSDPGRAIMRGLDGIAGPMVTDARGLFVVEARRGRVWLVQAQDIPAVTPEMSAPEPVDPEPPPG